ncbi:MAG: RNA polymerase sigma factor [Candidatus Riflebacteria bacterium]
MRSSKAEGTEESRKIAGMSDDDLVVAVQSGRQFGYEELFNRHSNAIFRYALSLLRNVSNAEDLLQDVFTTAFAKLEQYRGPGAFKRWLFKICRNLAFNFKKRRHLDESPLENQPEKLFDGGEPQKEWLEQLEIEESAKKILATLDDDLQEIMILRLVEDLSYREISELTGLNEANLRQMISRGLNRLRKELSANEL